MYQLRPIAIEVRDHLQDRFAKVYIPSCIIKPEHGRADFTKVPLGRGNLLFGCIAIEHCSVDAAGRASG